MKLSKDYILILFKRTQQVAFIIHTNERNITDEQLLECCKIFFRRLNDDIKAELVNDILGFTDIKITTPYGEQLLDWTFVTGFSQNQKIDKPSILQRLFKFITGKKTTF